MSYEWLLREGRIGSLELRSRIITSPMARGMSNRDGSMTQTYVDYLAERARGGASLIFTEGSYVDLLGATHAPGLGIHADHVIPSIKRAADAVHAEGAKFGIELFFGGRVGKSAVTQRQVLSPSVVAYNLEPVAVPREMTKADIDHVVAKFAEAADRSKRAGADMVHIHGGHGYLFSAFMTPFTNLRKDRYGGSLENRARFCVEVVTAIRDAVGPDFPIGYRLNGDDYWESGGATLEDAIGLAKLLVGAGIDLLDVSGGLYESKDMSIQGAGSPKGGFVANARAIKDAVGDTVAVSVVQRLNDPAFANDVLEREGLDFVTMARAFHADPHYLRKVREDRAEDIVPCIACLRCLDLHAVPTNVRCAANPATGLERFRRPRQAVTPRRIAVVGGGPAGLQTAKELAVQGHAVTLFERSDRLGGQINYSSRVATDYAYLVTYLTTQLEKLNVDVRLNTTADLATLRAEDPDAVVIATGARSGGLFVWPVDGEPTTFDLYTAFERPDEEWTGEKVVIVSGDTPSCVLAFYLVERGAEVHLIEPRQLFAWDAGAASRGQMLMKLDRTPAIHRHPETTVEQIGTGWATLQQHGIHRKLDGIGSFVMPERFADNGLYEELLRSEPELEVYAIGDAVSPREMFAATQEAAEVAELIRLRSGGEAAQPQPPLTVGAGIGGRS